MSVCGRYLKKTQKKNQKDIDTGSPALLVYMVVVVIVCMPFSWDPILSGCQYASFEFHYQRSAHQHPGFQSALLPLAVRCAVMPSDPSLYAIPPLEFKGQVLVVLFAPTIWLNPTL